MVIPPNPLSNHPRPATPFPAAWPPLISAALTTLGRLAGATEHDFLQIGNQLQDIYQRSFTLSETAHRLVEAASGDRIRALMSRLGQILQDMETYLAQTHVRNSGKCAHLDRVRTLLQQVGEPLQWFRRMSKQLYILEVSIKIESTYLGEMEGEFLNLAQDIKKLSLQIKEKTQTVQDHQVLLSTVITNNIADIHAANADQDANVRKNIGDTVASIAELESVNQRFSALGNEISSISKENSHKISGIVQSLQIHDIYRQQVEHVIEALEGYASSLSEASHQRGIEEDLSCQELIKKAGDICELQEAQLQFASNELYTAVASIVSNLHAIGTQQRQMGGHIYSRTGVPDTSSTSFVDEVSHHMASTTDLLTVCAETNKELAEVTKIVTGTVKEITDFVSDIENIGHEIIQIALNSRIKSACTGKNGASLSVLSKEIGQLSSDAVQRADAITATLNEIHSAIDVLSTEASRDEEMLGAKLSSMKEELNETLIILGKMGDELLYLLPQMHSQINHLTGEIEKIAGTINVHERTKALADEVLEHLKNIIAESRALHPASDAFKEDLRSMAHRYTMESERRIHEDIARKHGITAAEAQTPADPVGTDGEFGDNVDLF